MTVMSLVRVSRRVSRVALVGSTFVVFACATAETPDDDGTGPTSPAAGNASGGSTGGSLGSGGSLPLAGTTATGTSGSSSTSSAGKGGASSTSGGSGATTAGTTSSTAGTSATTGGTASGSCPPYTGTIAQDSAIFNVGFGDATTGTWTGYGYTYKYGTAVISPGMGNSCFAGAKFCANGSVPADDMSGAGLGWNIAQAMGATATTKVAVSTAVKLTFAGVKEGMRVQLSASSTTSYCYTFTAADAAAGTATVALASFKTACWGTAGTAYDGVTPIEAIQVAVPGSTTGYRTGVRSAHFSS
jgi:hypothetical protein